MSVPQHMLAACAVPAVTPERLEDVLRAFGHLVALEGRLWQVHTHTYTHTTTHTHTHTYTHTHRHALTHVHARTQVDSVAAFVSLVLDHMAALGERNGAQINAKSSHMPRAGIGEGDASAKEP